MQEDKPMTTVRLNVEDRAGVLYVSSNDVPGLWLWGSDPDEVFASVIPTIRDLYQCNLGLIVRVEEAQPSRQGWFGQDGMCDELEVYYVAEASHRHRDGRSTVE